MAPNILILDGLISSTEEEFLAVGEKLQKFQQQASEISNLSADVASRTSGDGIVKQNNGFINVSSEPGHGTTFNIYLPGLIGDAKKTQKKEMAAPARRGSETILIAGNHHLNSKSKTPVGPGSCIVFKCPISQP